MPAVGLAIVLAATAIGFIQSARPAPPAGSLSNSEAHHLDSSGAYVRRYVPELAAIEGRAIHEPWKLREHAAGYSTPIVDPA